MTSLYACRVSPCPASQPHLRQQKFALAQPSAAGAYNGASESHRAAAPPCWKRQRRQRCHSLPPAATTAEQEEKQQLRSQNSAGNLTTEALAKLRYVSPDGRWLVRPLNKSDMAEVRRIVSLQTDAFHSPAALPMFDGMAKRFFEAEVLSEMQKKIKFNPEELFCSLVIEPAATAPQQPQPQQDSEAAPSDGSSASSSARSNSSSSGGDHPGVVGVVEVSYISVKEILGKLEPGTEGFCYVASMVIAPAWRRRGGALALLRGAELAAGAWEETQTLLHVYQDNAPAIQLYQNAGYEILHSDSRMWAAVGSRPRHLMRKRW